MRYSVTIKNDINEVRTYTTEATSIDEALAKVGRTYRFTTENHHITEVIIKEI